MTQWHLGKKAQSVETTADDEHHAARYRRMRRVSLVGVLANAALSAAKLVLGWVAQSQSLIADGIHSLADALTDVAVVVTAKFSNQGADADHPYGHARIETAATAGLGVVLIATGLGIIWDALARLMDPSLLLSPSTLALVGAGLSIVINEGLYQYTRWVGQQVRSSLLIANAWHHRTDALSSVVVLIGVGGVLMGFEALDAIAAMVVALMIIRVGWSQLRSAFTELVDSGVQPERVDIIREAIMTIPGVSHPHRLRTRRMGEHVLVDVHVEVPETISVSEGHQLAERVQAHLKATLDDVSDVIVHIDPRGQDEVWLDLPDREAAMVALEAHWSARLGAPAMDNLQSVTLHYLDGHIDVDVIWAWPLSPSDHSGTDLQSLTRALQTAPEGLPWLGHVRVLFEPAPASMSPIQG